MEEYIAMYRGECSKCGGVLNDRRLCRTCLQCGRTYFNEQRFWYPFEVIGFVLFGSFFIMAVVADFWDLIVKVGEMLF